MEPTSERAALISGSPSPSSKSRSLLERARRQLEAAGFDATVIELSALPAVALLGRQPDDRVADAIQRVLGARIVVAGSPVYRATYSGLLKVFFDLLPQEALQGKVAVPILTGGSAAHLLALDHGMRPLFASVGAVVVSNGVYGYDAQFTSGGPDSALIERVDRAVEEAVSLARAAAESPVDHP